MDNLSFKPNSLPFESEDHKTRLYVSDFYRNAVVLVTGGTGFVGKVLVEKLLRSFDVRKIYILLREKRNVSPPERLKQLIKDPIFETIRRTIIHHDALFAKLEAVEVDFTVDEFVKEPLKTDLLNNTQIVFHVMGNVSFNKSLQTSLESNVNSAERLYTFIRNAKNLQSIVHVSTFYSNCDRPHIEEMIYDDIPFGGLDNVRRILKPLSETEEAALTPAILGTIPNSYIFSKKSAEVMIQKQFSELPIGIFRPPIVGPSFEEPVPGWVDCFQSLTGLSVPIIEHRFLRYYGDPNATSDIVPVDYCVSAIITAACDIRARYDQRKVLETVDKKPPSVPVYNFTFHKQRANNMPPRKRRCSCLLRAFLISSKAIPLTYDL
uniref:Fatty acyl-CoA reductase n=1 Tax=Anopheles atroparvus TaxID=41427 RepID=A0A182IYS1_ANOAO